MATIPKAKRYGSGDRLPVQAQQIWIILVGFVGFRRPGQRTYTYGDLAEAMGRDRRAGHTLGRQLGIIAEFCRVNRLPLLNTIVVDQDSGKPGRSVVRTPGATLLQDQVAARRFNWFSVRVPSTGTLRRVWEAMDK